jgi:rhodanese-related sulfurtransferase
MTPIVSARVLAVDPAPPSDAAAHFAARLAFETDPADVLADLAAGAQGIVVVDARSPEAYRQGHVPGAVNLPHAQIDEHAVALLPPGRTAVTYCAGPGCNASTKAAARLAALGVPVKEMIGGMEWWLREGWTLSPSTADTPGPACGC